MSWERSTCLAHFSHLRAVGPRFAELWSCMPMVTFPATFPEPQLLSEIWSGTLINVSRKALWSSICRYCSKESRKFCVLSTGKKGFAYKDSFLLLQNYSRTQSPCFPSFMWQFSGCPVLFLDSWVLQSLPYDPHSLSDASLGWRLCFSLAPYLIKALDLISVSIMWNKPTASGSLHDDILWEYCKILPVILIYGRRYHLFIHSLFYFPLPQWNSFTNSVIGDRFS